MNYCCVTQGELQRLGLVRGERHVRSCIVSGFCWGICGLGDSPVPEQVQTELLCSALFSQSASPQWVHAAKQNLFIKWTKFIAVLHSTAPGNVFGNRPSLGVTQIWCGSPSLTLMWLRQAKNTRHKAGTQIQNSNSSFQGVATSLILKLEKKPKPNRLSSILAATIWAVWLYLDVKPTRSWWTPANTACSDTEFKFNSAMSSARAPHEPSPTPPCPRWHCQPWQQPRLSFTLQTTQTKWEKII